MKALRLFHSAGLHVYPGKSGIAHLRYSQSSRFRMRRFESTQRAILQMPAAPGVVSGRMVLLDLILPADLPLALAADVYGLRDKPCIDWPVGDAGRTERRVLCCFTALAVIQKTWDAGTELRALEVLLGSLHGYEDTPQGSRLEELELDLICWAAHRLPKPLWAHVVGLHPMASLARRNAAMADTSRVPRTPIEESTLTRRAEAADMLDTAVAAARKASSSLVVELGRNVFRVAASERAAETLVRWGKNLMALRAQVEAGDVASAVVVAWQLDLVESGTLTQVDAAIGTRARYARIASLRLWQMLAGFPTDIQQWSAADLSAGYLAMMAAPPCNDLRGLGAAISSFQAFLQETFGLPTLPLGLHKLIPEPAPRAQWIPESAVRRAITWIDEATKSDPRLRRICSLKILLAFNAPLRLGELRWLRLANIAETANGGIEIEIVPLGGVSPLKSPAATRRVVITDPAAVARLEAETAQREAEGASADSLLFAAPDNNDAPYRALAVHLTLLRVLKHATGDPAMTFHALRHTYISNAMEALLSSCSISNNNRLAQLADLVGHEVVVTTLAFYSHWPEFALRLQVDSILEEMPLGNMDGERILGIKANTLTVTARRRQVSVGRHVWRTAEQQVGFLVHKLPSASAGLDLHEPEPISLTGALNRSFTVHHCTMAITALAQGLDRALIQHRMQLTRAQLDSVDNAAVDVARRLYASRDKLAPSTLIDTRTVLKHLRIDPKRTDQERYEGVRRLLSLPLDHGPAAAASAVWTACWWKGVLSADPPTRLTPLLAFLKSAGVESEAFLLTYEDDGTDVAAVQALLASAADVSAAVFHNHLHTKALPNVCPRRARAFLVWPSRHDAGAAGRSNGGFDALMFSLAVWASPEVQQCL